MAALPVAAATEAAGAITDLAVGPAVLGLVEPSEVLEVFAELGVVFLLFWVGLETRLHEMSRAARSGSSSPASAPARESSMHSSSRWSSACPC
ncbi:MAG: cation:proton antiporter [Actinomycetota bacterium]|nr:cation:proton antiporter [Actinomycetota bacterium]